MKSVQFNSAQRGHGMTENIVIVAVIALTAFAVYQFFAQTIRSQTASIANEVSGKSASTDTTNAQTAATSARDEGTKKRGLDAYTNDKSR